MAIQNTRVLDAADKVNRAWVALHTADTWDRFQHHIVREFSPELADALDELTLVMGIPFGLLDQIEFADLPRFFDGK